MYTDIDTPARNDRCHQTRNVEVCHDLPRHDLHCPECGVDGRLARGDAFDLPTFIT
ncbi:MAG: hypothetical protein GKR94_13200 [Gammaproteobacteria bacterium]|nr:hypothetical protein [Gammaproteobacteria bacterium]